MFRNDNFSEKALALASQVSDSLKGVIPTGAGKWLQTGAMLGVARSGTRVAGKFIRRNPAAAAAAAVGAGLLLYVARRQQKKAQARSGAIEGKSTRIEAKRAAPRKAAKRGSPRAARATKKATTPD